jgi:hypothetical protein
MAPLIRPVENLDPISLPWDRITPEEMDYVIAKICDCPDVEVAGCTIDACDP